MTFFEQIGLWEAYAMMPGENAPMPDPANMQFASESLQKRSAETLALLQRYLEPAAEHEQRPANEADPPAPEPPPAARPG